MLIYLAHPDRRIAVCESESTAQARLAQGFVRCSPDLYATFWQLKDFRRYAELRRRGGAAGVNVTAAQQDGWTLYGVNGKVKQ